MALIVTIAGTNRTRLIDPSSFSIQSVLTKQVDTATFAVHKFGARTFAPTVGQEVIITLGATRVFGGRIIRVSEDYDKLDFVGYRVECVDYTRDLDRRLVVQNYSDMTVEAIIADIADTYFDANISVAGVDCPINVDQIAFNYEYPSKCIQQLAELTNYDWYIDYNKVLYFFSKEDNSAPFELSDTGGKYIYETLSIRKDISPVRNTIYVRGGEYKADPFTAEKVADGSQLVFDTGYRFSDISCTVTGQLKSIGIDGIDRETDYDILYNFQEKILKFREDKKPSASSVVKWWGRPWLPVIVKLRDNTSISTFSATEGGDGIYEFKIIDKSIESKEAARQRARAELLAYAATLNEGSFDTYSAGLRVGQRIHVQSTLRGIDAYYVINRVRMVPVVNATDATYQMRYTIGLMTTRTFDYIDLLQKLLLEKDKSIDISSDEVLDEIESSFDTLTIAEDVTFTTATPPYYWGPGYNPQLYWNLGEWS